MKVTFLAVARILGYLPGRIYEEDLTPLLEAVLRNDVQLRLIDPPTLDEYPTPKVERGLNGSN